MLTIHHLNDSRSQRLFWLLELAELDYTVKSYERNPKTQLAPDELKQIHPLGTAPILTHDDVCIPESGGICEYIAHLSKQPLIPQQGTKDYFDVQFWTHYAEGSFMPPLVASMVLNKARSKSPWFIKPIANKLLDAILNAYFNVAIKRNFAFVETYLKGRTWFVGDKPSIADVQMSFALEAVYDVGRLKDFPNMTAYVEHLRNTPSHIKAMEKMKLAEQARA